MNSTIASSALRGYFGSRWTFRNTSDAPNEFRSPNLKSEWSTNAEEFFRSGELVSVRYYTFISFVDAAHPNHNISTEYFLGDERGTASIQDFLGYSVEAARKIMEYCERVIIAQSDGELNVEQFFRTYEESDERLWDLLSDYGFDSKGLTFNFSPYDILAYAFGSHEVHVPWSFLEEKIADDYKSVVEELRGRR